MDTWLAFSFFRQIPFHHRDTEARLFARMLAHAFSPARSVSPERAAAKNLRADQVGMSPKHAWWRLCGADTPVRAKSSVLRNFE